MVCHMRIHFRARVMNQGSPINLTDEQRKELEHRVRSQTLDARSVQRARIVFLAADGVSNHEIAGRFRYGADSGTPAVGRYAFGGSCNPDHCSMLRPSRVRK